MEAQIPQDTMDEKKRKVGDGGEEWLLVS